MCVRNEGLLWSLLVTSATVSVATGKEGPLWAVACPCLFYLLLNSDIDFMIVVEGRYRHTDREIGRGHRNSGFMVMTYWEREK